MPEFQQHAVFALADLHAPEGKTFAVRHNVPNTVLIFFAGSGRKIETVYGAQEKDELRGKIKRILGINP